MNSFGENRVTRVQTETENGFTCSLVESRPWQLEDQELHFYARCSSSQLAKARDFCTAVGESSGHKRFNHLAGGESRSSRLFTKTGTGNSARDNPNVERIVYDRQTKCHQSFPL